MVTQVVPVRISREILEAIDRLVELGVFSSRSEALREIVKEGLTKYEKLTRIAKGVERLFEIERERGEIPIKLSGALKQLLSERERFG